MKYKNSGCGPITGAIMQDMKVSELTPIARTFCGVRDALRAPESSDDFSGTGSVGFPLAGGIKHLTKCLESWLVYNLVRLARTKKGEPELFTYAITKTYSSRCLLGAISNIKPVLDLYPERMSWTRGELRDALYEVRGEEIFQQGVTHIPSFDQVALTLGLLPHDFISVVLTANTHVEEFIDILGSSTVVKRYDITNLSHKQLACVCYPEPIGSPIPNNGNGESLTPTSTFTFWLQPKSL